MKWPAMGICRAYYGYGSKYFHWKQIDVIVQESGLKKEKGNWESTLTVTALPLKILSHLM